jgi:hypothetical protein
MHWKAPHIRSRLRSITAGLILVAALISAAQADGDKSFTLTLDGQDYEINIGDTIKAKTKDGAEVDIALTQKEFTTFTKGKVSFMHRSGLSVATTDVEADIHQYMAATALGTLVIVQEYDKTSTVDLVDFMMTQMTRDSVATGMTGESKPATRTLADGTVLNGKTKTLTGHGDTESFEILGANVGRGGILLITRQGDANPDEATIIDKFWQTLKIAN